MQWSPEQDNALLAVQEWLKNKDKQVFRLFGYAGTGKTTLAKELAQGVRSSVFAAYTGKAAHVLTTKGCPASTIHSLIYSPRSRDKTVIQELNLSLMTLKSQVAKKEGDYKKAETEIKQIEKTLEEYSKDKTGVSFVLNHESHIKDCDLIVIDECSMVNDDMGNDLLSFDVPVLVLGDPAQLPPVKGSGFFTENCTPDFMLTEIHRQAAENPIIELATRARKGLPISLGHYGQNEVIGINQITKERVLEADQLIVGKNVTRHSYNNRVRQLLGRTSPYPEVGDKVVCLKNNAERGLLNGSLWKATEVFFANEDNVNMEVTPIDNNADNVEVNAFGKHFIGKGDEIQWWEKGDADEFDYGYALTCHKCQGSQWDNVVVFDESKSFRASKDRWLYTAITRAAEKLTIVKD